MEVTAESVPMAETEEEAETAAFLETAGMEVRQVRMAVEDPLPQ